MSKRDLIDKFVSDMVVLMCLLVWAVSQMVIEIQMFGYIQ